MPIVMEISPGRRSYSLGSWRFQGAENFKKELEQLRRAFRYDEFETVTAAAPPKNIGSKVHCYRPSVCRRYLFHVYPMLNRAESGCL